MHSSFDPGVHLWVALVVGLAFSAFMVLARRRYRSLPNLEAAGNGSIPDCMAVIPARNEEFVIGGCVKSLPHDTVIVVDDDSSDGTAEVARKSGAGVMKAPSLPKRGIGKANACAAGARALTSKWILFADADTWFEPEFLKSAVAFAEASGIAFVSFYPRVEFGSVAETILAPYAQALFFSGVSPGKDVTAVFNGQCMLVRREAYEFIGSHGAVMNTLTDDVKLAGLARRHRLKVASVRAESLAHVRFREPARSFRRAAFRFMAIEMWMGMVLMTAAMTAALWLPVLVWLIVSKAIVAAVIFGLLPSIVTLPWYRNPLRALAAPVAIYAMLPILWSGVFAALGGRRVKWKGRVI